MNAADSVKMYFDILRDASRPSNPETTRLAALRSLRTLSPAMTSSSHQMIPAFVTLLHFLSDDDYEIRQLASEITGSLLGNLMVSAPVIASERLAQMIGETFDADSLERVLCPIMCFDVRTTLVESLNSEQVLFAKERENIWRDEICQWELYLRILSTCWSRPAKAEAMPFVEWAEKGVSAIREVVDKHEDTSLGWGNEVDLFEAVVKVLMLCKALLNFNCGKGVLDVRLEELKGALVEKGSHEYWVAKLEGILQSRGAVGDGGWRSVFKEGESAVV